MIGLSVVAVGTSIPELLTNLTAVINGHSRLVLSNIIGSNIINLFLVTGLSGMIFPLRVRADTIRKEIPFSLFVTVLLYLLLFVDLTFLGEKKYFIYPHDGGIMIILFWGFGYYLYKILKNAPEEESNRIQRFSLWHSLGMVVGGTVGLLLGGKYYVSSAIDLARSFQVSEKFIGLTIIALGTSLPELVTSVVAAIKRKADIVVGNVIGSNIFNILLTLGITPLIGPIEYDPSLNVDMYLLIGGTVLLILFMFTLTKRKLDRLESFIYLLLFIVYVAYVFLRK